MDALHSEFKIFLSQMNVGILPNMNIGCLVKRTSDELNVHIQVMVQI
jgi:hypothetical protein